MEAIDRYTIGAILFWGGLLLWVAETWYFGWNLTPQSRAEVIMDVLSSAMVLGGLFLRIKPNP